MGIEHVTFLFSLKVMFGMIGNEEKEKKWKENVRRNYIKKKILFILVRRETKTKKKK